MSSEQVGVGFDGGKWSDNGTYLVIPSRVSEAGLGPAGFGDSVAVASAKHTPGRPPGD